jgi:hypothetical protein
MSGTQPTPDWWLASDGRWYAQWQHPSYRGPAIPAQSTAAPTDIGLGEPSSSGDTTSPKQVDSSKKRRSGPIVAGSIVVALILIVFIVTTTNKESILTGETTTTAIPAPVAAPATSPSATAPSATTPPTAPPETTPPAVAPPATAAPSAASGKVHIGGELFLTGLDGSKVAVALNQVIDPATGTDGPPRDTNGSLTNSSYVATVITIVDIGSKPIRDDANDDAALIGSDGRDYTPDFDAAVSHCRNFNSGEYSIGPGEKATGCVAFALPAGVAPAALQWAPAGFSNDSGEWLIP